MDLEYRTEEHAGITLVEVALENPHQRPRYVELVSELDGPVLPPRESGYPAEGWDDSGYRGTVEAGETLPLGYACPAAATDPPVRIDVADPTTDPPTTRSAGDIVRELGDPRPPTDAIDDPGPSDPPDITTTGDEECVAVPPAIDAWFDAIATRLDNDDPVDADRVGAVADRAADLHRRCRR